MKTINVTIVNLKNYFRLYLCQSMCVCLSIRRSMQVNVCDLISNSQWVHLFIAVNAGTKSSALVLLGYAQLALNADATFEFCPHECNKGLLPTILLCTPNYQPTKGLHSQNFWLQPSLFHQDTRISK